MSPNAFAEIDWTKKFDFLDKELASITPESELKNRVVDKLVKVWLKEGGETWLLVHVEVQTQSDKYFAQRMYTYHYRLFDHYGKEVVSFAILADDNPHWRPKEYHEKRWDYELLMRFPIIKLLDYEQRWSKIMMAMLKELTTRKNLQNRLETKIQLSLALYEQGYSALEIVRLIRFYDWIIDLSDELEMKYVTRLEKLEEVKKVDYVTSFERYGIKKGRQEGVQQGIQIGLKTKFGEAGLALMNEIKDIKDIEVLQRIMEKMFTAQTLEDIRLVLP